MKLIVETTGPFWLTEPHQAIPYNRPAVVSPTRFLELRAKAGQIRVVAGGLDDEATDAEFAAYLKESEDQGLAIAAFVDKYDGQLASEQAAPDSAASEASSASTPTPARQTKAEKKAAAKAEGAE